MGSNKGRRLRIRRRGNCLCAPADKGVARHSLSNFERYIRTGLIHIRLRNLSVFGIGQIIGYHGGCLLINADRFLRSTGIARKQARGIIILHRITGVCALRNDRGDALRGNGDRPGAVGILRCIRFQVV